MALLRSLVEPFPVKMADYRRASGYLTISGASLPKPPDQKPRHWSGLNMIYVIFLKKKEWQPQKMPSRKKQSLSARAGENAAPGGCAQALFLKSR